MRTFLLGAFAVCLVLGGDHSVRAEDKARAVIEKAIKAVGGADKLGKYPALTWKSKGTFYGLGQPLEFTAEYFQQGPGKFKNQIEADFNGTKLTRIVILNVDKGWVSMMGNVDDMNEDQMTEAKNSVYTGSMINSLLPLAKDADYKLAPLGEQRVADRPAVGVKVSHKGYRDLSLYFDKETGLLVKSQMRMKDLMSGQEVEEETYLSDYKEMGGVLRHKKHTIKRDGKDYLVAEATEYKGIEKLENSVFDKPG
jgi:hypothetical protein